MRGPARIATYLAVGMGLAGFGLIFFSWNGAAELDRIQGQFPFAMSGGLGGLGLVIVASGLLYIQTHRRVTAQRNADLEELEAQVRALITNLAPPGTELVEPAASGPEGTEPLRPALHARTVARAGANRPEGGFAPQPRRPAAARAGTTDGPDRRAGAAGTAAAAATATTTDPAADTEDHAGWGPDSGHLAEEPAGAASTVEGEQIRTALAEVPGVGPAKQDQLAAHFGTLQALRRADVADIAEVPGISRTLAVRIHSWLRS